jgi:nucleoid-associated protein YgaU
MEAVTGADGKWAVTLPTTVPGIYTLRIDQMGPDGAVASRFETPFKRETLEALAAASGTVPPAPAVIAELPAAAAIAETAPAAAPEPVAPEAVAVAEGSPEVAAPVPAAPAAPAAALAAATGAGSDAARAPPAAEPAVPAADAISPVPATGSADPVAAAPVQAAVTVTVQPGFTLWGIATERFGEGRMYVQVFEANRDSIKNPDLIYPGQVFTLPQE